MSGKETFVLGRENLRNPKGVYDGAKEKLKHSKSFLFSWLGFLALHSSLTTSHSILYCLILFYF